LKLGELAIYGCNRVRKSLSRILEMLFRLEIGRKFADTVGSRPGFFKSGVTCRDLLKLGRKREMDTFASVKWW